MPVLKSYPNGLSMGGRGGNPAPSKRGAIAGWSPAAARRNTQFLYSVQTSKLTGYGVALTLTLGVVPETSEEFTRLRRVYLVWLQRQGAIRYHFVVEWQERMVPHLHLAVYFQDPVTPVTRAVLMAKWVMMTSHLRTSARGQDCKPIDGVTGWLKYLAKHAARGAKHYQRKAYALPDGWTRSGQMWGHGGNWPVEEPLLLEFDGVQAARARRLVKSWAIADARSAGDWKRLSYLRRIYKNSDPVMSRVRGISDWVPQPILLKLSEVIS